MNEPPDTQEASAAPPFLAKPDATPAERIAAYKEALGQILAANGWKRGSQKARIAEYCFIIGVTSAGPAPLPYLQICVESGRPILD